MSGCFASSIKVDAIEMITVFFLSVYYEEMKNGVWYSLRSTIAR